MPIPIPSGVTVNIKENTITVKGPRGSLPVSSIPICRHLQGNVVTVARPSDERNHRALHGLTRSLLANMVAGVTKGFEKTRKSRASGTVPRSPARSWYSGLEYRTRWKSYRPRDISDGGRRQQDKGFRHRPEAVGQSAALIRECVLPISIRARASGMPEK